MEPGDRRNLPEGTGETAAYQSDGPRLLRATQLLGALCGPALERIQQGQLQPQQGAQGARQGPLRAGEGQGAHPRISGSAETEGGYEVADTLSGRPSGRGQNLLGQVYRRRPRAQVRARVAGRFARRVRNPRPPQDLHRRYAGAHHPEYAQGRLCKPRLCLGRNRQNHGNECARRPLSRPSGGDGP